MATSQPISTISYNSLDFLKNKLDIWYRHHMIQCYMFICHKGEDGDKDHIHVRIEPNKRLDPMDLSDMLKEPDPHNTKPLGCRPWRSSKEEDWFLYAIHDKEYLKVKYGNSNKDGKIEYDISDIICSEGYDVECAVLRARQSFEHHTANIVKQLKDGKKRAVDLIEDGEDVFRVQAVLRTLSITDYEQLAYNNNLMAERLTKLERAIYASGVTQIVEDGDKIIFI